MLARLRASAGTVFKEHPDDHGGDLMLWKASEVTGGTDPTVVPSAVPTVVTVHRVQVKLGASSLALGQVGVSLTEGWNKIKG